MRPKVLFDIKSANKTFREPLRINLNGARLIRIPLKLLGIVFIVLFFIYSYIFNFASAPENGGVLAQTNAEERQQLQSQLAELEKQIAQDEAQIAEYKKKGNTLQSEISKLNAQVAKFNAQIKAITLSLKKLDQDLQSTQTEIVVTVNKIDTKKEIIGNILQNMYQQEDKSMAMIFLANSSISDFFTETNRMDSVQEKLRNNVEELNGLHNKLSDQKESLAMEKEDVMNLKAFQEAQKVSIQKTQQEKNDLLKVTKGKESEYQKIVLEKKKTAEEIRSRLYEFLGGGALSFGDAYRLAKMAEDATGVRAALILAVLDKESALGKNTGKCRYDQNPYYPTRASNKTSMHPTRDIPIFLDITNRLGIDPTTTLVSCPIPSDGAYGGAMGPAQFLPSTWKLYEAKIATVLGKSNASPWSNLDAFTATALYLKNAGAGSTLYSEKVAAARYYAGGNWQRYVNSYGARVVDKAQQFEEDIKTLNGLAMR